MFRHADAPALDLEPLPLDEIVSGSPVAAVAELGHLGDVAYGVWELSEGTVRDTEADEVFVVLSGRGEIAFEDGLIVSLAAGSVVRLNAGERTVWRIDERLRKVWFTA